MMSGTAIKTRNILYEKGIYLEDGTISTVMINALSGTLTTRFIDDLEETVQNFNAINSVADFWWTLYDHDRYLELGISIENTYKLMGTPVPDIINAILYSNDRTLIAVFLYEFLLDIKEMISYIFIHT